MTAVVSTSVRMPVGQERVRLLYEEYVHLTWLQQVWNQPVTNRPQLEPCFAAALHGVELCLIMLGNFIVDVRTHVPKRPRIEAMALDIRAQCQLLGDLVDGELELEGQPCVLSLTQDFPFDGCPPTTQHSDDTVSPGLRHVLEAVKSVKPHMTSAEHHTLIKMALMISSALESATARWTVGLGIEHQLNALLALLGLPHRVRERAQNLDYEALVRPQCVEATLTHETYSNPEDYFFRHIHLGTECWMFVANCRARDALAQAKAGHFIVASARIMHAASILTYLGEHMMSLTRMNLKDYLELKVQLEGTSGAGSSQVRAVRGLVTALMEPLQKEALKLGRTALAVPGSTVAAGLEEAAAQGYSPEEEEQQLLAGVMDIYLNCSTHASLYNYCKALEDVESGLLGGFYYRHYCLAVNVIGSKARGTMRRAVAGLKHGYETPIFPVLDAARCALGAHFDAELGHLKGRMMDSIMVRYAATGEVPNRQAALIPPAVALLATSTPRPAKITPQTTPQSTLISAPQCTLHLASHSLLQLEGDDDHESVGGDGQHPLIALEPGSSSGGSACGLCPFMSVLAQPEASADKDVALAMLPVPTGHRASEPGQVVASTRSLTTGVLSACPGPPQALSDTSAAEAARQWLYSNNQAGSPQFSAWLASVGCGRLVETPAQGPVMGSLDKTGVHESWRDAPLLAFLDHAWGKQPVRVLEAGLQGLAHAALQGNATWDHVFGQLLPRASRLVLEQLGLDKSAPARVTAAVSVSGPGQDSTGSGLGPDEDTSNGDELQHGLANVHWAHNSGELTLRLLSCYMEREVGGRPLTILTSDQEFYSLTRLLNRLTQQHEGATGGNGPALHVVVEVVAAQPPTSFVQRLVERARSLAPEVVYVSQITYLTQQTLVPDIPTLVTQLASVLASSAAAGRPPPLILIDGYHGFLAIPTCLCKAYSCHEVVSGRVALGYLGGLLKHAGCGANAAFVALSSSWQPRPLLTGWLADVGVLAPGSAGIGPGSLVAYTPGLALQGGTPGYLFPLHCFVALLEFWQDPGVEQPGSPLKAGAGTALGHIKLPAITLEAVHAHVLQLQEEFVAGLKQAEARTQSCVLRICQLENRADSTGQSHTLVFNANTPAQAAAVVDALLCSGQGVSVDCRKQYVRVGLGFNHSAADIHKLLWACASAKLQAGANMES